MLHAYISIGENFELPKFFCPQVALWQKMQPFSQSTITTCIPGQIAKNHLDGRDPASLTKYQAIDSSLMCNQNKSSAFGCFCLFVNGNLFVG